MKKDTNSRRQYHREYYNNLSPEKKLAKSQQVRKALVKKMSNLSPAELAVYKKQKKERDSIYYYNKKLKSIMKDLQDLELNSTPSKSKDCFGCQRFVSQTPNYIDQLYRYIGSNKLPGGFEGCYGEITKVSLHKICLSLLRYGLVTPKQTVTLDLGSGFGRPSFHMGGFFQSLSIGIEFDPNLWLSSMANLFKVSNSLSTVPPVYFLQGDIMNLQSLEGFGLLYGFDCLFPPTLLTHIGKLFNESSTTKVLVTYCSKKSLQLAGFKNLTLKAKVPVRMSGSSESKTAWIYTKKRTSASLQSVTTTADVDSLFEQAFEMYHDGTLEEANKAIDVVAICDSPRKLRSRSISCIAR